jgi:hypothetical protein
LFSGLLLVPATYESRLHKVYDWPTRNLIVISELAATYFIYENNPSLYALSIDDSDVRLLIMIDNLNAVLECRSQQINFKIYLIMLIKIHQISTPQNHNRYSINYLLLGISIRFPDLTCYKYAPILWDTWK